MSATSEDIHRLVSIGKIIVGTMISCVIGIAGVAVWVNQTTTAVAESTKKIEAIAIWKSETDKLLSRVVAIQEGQQRLMEKLDRQPSPNP